MSATLLARDMVRAVLVDDTEDLRMLLRLMLEEQENVVVVAEAGNGVEAIDAVRLTQPDLVLLDLAMPVMDGLEALPAIRRACAEATIVVLSGFDGDVMAPKALLAGADGYVRKGASPAEIVDRINALRHGGPSATAVGPSSQPASQPGSPSQPPAGRWAGAQATAAGDDVLAGHLGQVVESGPLGVMALSDPEEPGGLLRLGWANATARRMLGADEPEADAPSVHLHAVLELVGSRRGEIAEHGEVHDEIEVRDGWAQLWAYGDPARPSVVLVPRRGAPQEAQVDTFIASAAHEMRNPVSILIGATDALVASRDRLDTETQNKLLEAVNRQARLLSRATTDLLTAARHQNGSLSVDIADVDVAGIVTSLTLSQPDARPMEVDCPAGVRVLADGARLEQMLANLVSNAVKYGERPFAVVVDGDQQTVNIRVRDSGAGVRADFVDQLFDKFTREGGRSVPGTGLGLYIVRSLAQAQGGTVSYATSPRGGAEFVVSLPRAPGGPPPAVPA